MKKIVLATSNPGKLSEMKKYFEGLKNFKFLSLSDFEPIDPPEETGQTFEANAAQKAIFYGQKLGMAVLAEDSGFVLEAFPKKFGVRTRREISAKNDEEWLKKFLDFLSNVENRRATFYSAISFFEPSTETSATFLGWVSGSMTKSAEANLEAGIPISAVFRAEGEKLVFSALDLARKNQISHRARAARKMEAFLRNQKERF